MPRRRKSKAVANEQQLAKAKIEPRPQTAPDDAPPESAGTTFPDLKSLGGAFDQAISYMRSQRHHNIESIARDSLMKSVSEIITGLQRELQELHTKKDNPMLYPAYALDGQQPLLISTSIPYSLIQYRDQFTSCLLQVLQDCGFSAASTPGMPGYFSNRIAFEITFNNDFINDEMQTIKNRVFDPKAQEKLIAGVARNLRIED